ELRHDQPLAIFAGNALVAEVDRPFQEENRTRDGLLPLNGEEPLDLARGALHERTRVTSGGGWEDTGDGRWSGLLQLLSRREPRIDEHTCELADTEHHDE